MTLSRTSIFYFLMLALGLMPAAQAAQTVCNDNSGAGWSITDYGTSNLTIPFNFGDVSRAFDVTVSTDITHTYIGDLRVDAESPAGTTVVLFDRPGTAAASGSPYGCSGDDLSVTFDDNAANPPLENITCGNLPAYSGTYQPHNAAPNNLSAFDGQDLNGSWTFILTDNANQDTGTLNEVCMTSSFAGVTFDVWVSSNASCSDTIDNLVVAPGTQVYYCYIAENPGDVPYTINAGASHDDHGVDISSLEHSYAAGSVDTFTYGPVIAGSTELPSNATTTHIADVTASFASAGFTGDLFTDETAVITVADPVFSTSTKTVEDVNGGAVLSGDVLRYTITINETAGTLVQNVQLTDVVDANLANITLTSLPSGATDNSSGNTLDISGIEIAAGGSVVVEFEATILAGTPSGTAIDNTASISHAASGVSTSVSAPTIIVAIPDFSTSVKDVVDVNGGSLLAGETVRYTITINESAGLGSAAVQVQDVLSANLQSLSVVSMPAGAVNNSGGNTLDISNINVPASGSAQIVFDAQVLLTASVGTSINNTATIIDTVSSTSVDVSAPLLVVGSVPASGSKYLYLDTLNGTADLTRVPPGVNTNSGYFNANGGSITLDQQLAFQAPFTISAGTMDISFTVLRNNGGTVRDVQVDLYKVAAGSATLIGTDSATYNIQNPWSPQVYATFQIALASDVNFSPGDFIRLVITNTTSANNNNRIQIRTLYGGNVAYIQMQSSTVINVDSVSTYAAAYPATTQQLSYLPGSTVYFRTTVSDPFGSADITNATLTLIDPNGAVVINGATLTAVATPTGSTKVYEYSSGYTLPTTPEGMWTVSVTADEGSEGEVSHTAENTLIVGRPQVSVTKLSQVISDPVNGTSSPKAIPGAVVEYAILVTNTGFGYVDADSLVVADTIPSEASLLLSPTPFQFTDGSVSSGLTFSFISLGSATDDVEFSSDGGSSTFTPSMDANGFDSSVPKINYIRIRPGGAFNTSDGTNNPSFTLRFRARLD